MIIENIVINNYKSIQALDLKLGKGIHVLTGQNSAGKTAVLEALSLDFTNIPHASILTRKSPEQDPIESSHVEVTFTTSLEELKELVVLRNGRLSLPVDLRISSNPEEATRELWRRVRSEERLRFRCRVQPGKSVRTRPRPSYLHPIIPDSLREGYEVDITETDVTPRSRGRDHGVDVALQFSVLLTDRIFRFAAERLKIGSSQLGRVTQLAVDCSNLPTVLDQLKRNPTKLEEYRSLVQQVLPGITTVTTSNIDDRNVGIYVWHHPEESGRDDLAIPLEQCGTGVSQVLAILYVLVTTHVPITILVDEPNSFLHPGAVRALLDVFRSYDQHQYIISTHSPLVIYEAAADTVHLLKYASAKFTTQAQSVDVGNIEDVRGFLLDLGADFGALFGSRGVIWVEGPTEELLFPLIWQKCVHKSKMGVAICGVVSTGDFYARRPSMRDKAKLVVEIYRRVTSVGGILPEPKGFVFDTEGRTPEDLDRIRLASPGNIKFLSRRCIENYLLEAESISNALNRLPSFQASPTDAKDVRDWIERNGSLPQYQASASFAEKPDAWLQSVNAPILLQALWRELSDGKEEFTKTRDSVAIGKYLLECNPEHFREIADVLSGLVENA